MTDSPADRRHARATLSLSRQRSATAYDPHNGPPAVTARCDAGCTTDRCFDRDPPFSGFGCLSTLAEEQQGSIISAAVLRGGTVTSTIQTRSAGAVRVEPAVDLKRR